MSDDQFPLLPVLPPMSDEEVERFRRIAEAGRRGWMQLEGTRLIWGLHPENPIDKHLLCRHSRFYVPSGVDETLCLDCRISATHAIEWQRAYIAALEEAVQDLKAEVAELKGEREDGA
jgi:hypothetical protein